MPNPAPTVRLRRLASELVQLRRSANLKRDDVVRLTGINMATVYRIESAKTRPQPRTLRSLLDVYGVDEKKRVELLAILKDAGERGWLQSSLGLPEQYATYIQFESEARRLLNYESLFVPGLLQTEGYARAVIQGTDPSASDTEVEERVAARLERQALMASRSVELLAIADEAALRRSVGGTRTMRAQIRRLLAVADEPNITFQVIPFEAGAHTGMTGGFVVMKFPEGMPDVIYMEHLTSDHFLEQEADTCRYNLSFNGLQAIAASQKETQVLLSKILPHK